MGWERRRLGGTADSFGVRDERVTRVRGCECGTVEGQEHRCIETDEGREMERRAKKVQTSEWC